MVERWFDGGIHMKRFAATEQWNDEIANNFREQFLAKYGVDLKKYIPQDENDFETKWQLVENETFGDVDLFACFEEKYINRKIVDIISGISDGNIIFNAVNRYEFYEPDIWIGAAYTIRYLERKELIQKTDNSGRKKFFMYSNLNLSQMMTNGEYEKDVVYGDIDYFGNGFLKFVTKKKPDIFSFLFDKESEKCIWPKSAEDVTRWTYLKMLEVEKDTFRSKLKRQDACSKNNGSSISFKLEDYILFLKLSNGELVRRIVPLYWNGHGIKFNIFDLINIDKLCSIESFSWQILLTEIKKQLEIGDNNIFPVYFGGDVDIDSFYKKYVLLLEWESKILNKDIIDTINKKRRFLIKAMIYLYMSSDEKIRPSLFEEIQIIALKYLDVMSTSTFYNVKATVSAYIQSFQKEKGKKEANENRKGERKEDILPDGIDSLTLNMIDDLEHRIRKKKDEGINELGKIQLQKHENTLTALYVVLQKVIIQSTAQHYGIGEKDNKVQSLQKSNL